MMAYILLEYSSDGPPPSTVDRRMRGLGLSRDGAYFVLRAADEREMQVKIDRLHDALSGSGARYTVTAGEAAEEVTEIVLELEPQDAMLDEQLLGSRMEEVSDLLRSGARSFDDLLDAIDSNEGELEAVLEVMVERGLVAAHLRDDEIRYRLAGPMLRSMSR
jgi:hypothetical protein